MTQDKIMMIKNITRKILKTSALISIIAQSVFLPNALFALDSKRQTSSEHLFEISDHPTDFSRKDLQETGKKEAAPLELRDDPHPLGSADDWNIGWENDAAIDESDPVTFFPESEQNHPFSASKEETPPASQKYLSDPDRLVPVDQPLNNPLVEKVLSLSKKRRVPDSPSSADRSEFHLDSQQRVSNSTADISSVRTSAYTVAEKKPHQPKEIEEKPVFAEPVQHQLGKKIVTVDPYISLQEDRQKNKKQKHPISPSKSQEAPEETAFEGSLSGSAALKQEITESAEDKEIIAQALPGISLPSTQGRTPPKTILINFNNVSIIEYIRFISKITNRNFIFDEKDLQFNVTIISEEPTTIENVMTALIQELRIHGLRLIEQDNNLIIHKNAQERSISRVNTNGAPEVSPRESELVTQVFRLNTLDPSRAQRIIVPLLSSNAIIEVAEDTRHLIITDIVTNIKEVEILIKDIDSPNSGMVIGQYVARNAFIDNLIELAQQIMEPIAQDQSLTFVPHPAAKSIFIVSSPFIVERTISVLQHLDQFQGTTRIYDLDELKFQQIAPKESAPGLAPDGGGVPTPQQGEFPLGQPSLPSLPQRPDLPGSGAERGKWELGSEGNWIFRPGFPEQQKTSKDLPQGQWLLDPQGNWYFQPAGGSAPFSRKGEAPSSLGIQRGTGQQLLPGKTPRGRWDLDPSGYWIFQLDPREEIKPARFSRPAFTEEELPVGNIERTQFYIHKLEFRRGEDIVDALQRISESLTQCGNANEDLICTIQSAQWLEASNSLVFAGTAASIEKVRELVSEIDRPLRQVFIEMLILETTLEDSLDYGVAWGSHSGGGSTATAQAYIGGASPLVGALNRDLSGTNTPDASNLITDVGYTLGIIGRRLTHNGTQFATLGALVTAQHNRQNSKVILNPKIITEDNKTAELFVGINTRFQTNSISNDEGSVITTNFEYRDVGTTIRVTPLIGNGDIVTLEIEEEVSRVAPQAVQGGSDIQDPNAPTTSISRTSTTVHVPDRHFVIISGLIQDEKIHSRNQFPCLGGIPIIGAAFSAKINDDVKRTQMLFIRPQIIDTDEEIRRLTSEQQEMYKQKSRVKKSWKYEVDEGMDFLNIKPPCCDECE